MYPPYHFQSDEDIPVVFDTDLGNNETAASGDDGTDDTTMCPVGPRPTTLAANGSPANGTDVATTATTDTVPRRPLQQWRPPAASGELPKLYH